MRIEPIHDLEKLDESMFLAEEFWHFQFGKKICQYHHPTRVHIPFLA